MMGGYAIYVKENSEDVSPRRIRLKPEDFLKLQSPELPTKVELMDKSKGDWISKSITSLQVIWFISQLVGRAVRQLPVTTLELFTCAIIVCTAATYAVWWNKPLNVQCPIFLGSEVPAAFLVDHKICALKTYYSITDIKLPNSYEIGGSKGGSFIVLIILAFTACHLIGWNFYFPTRTEQLLWRMASVLCAVMPAMSLFCIYFTDPAPAGSKHAKVWGILTLFCMSAYFLVRAYLLVEVFISLRSIPMDAYTAVDWSAYIPHI
jgi:hypothetical protein